jgi:glycosyltransferase involved in cell wall biosynthesis
MEPRPSPALDQAASVRPEAASERADAALRRFSVLHLNSLLTGGGTDDRSVRIARALAELGHSICLAGPSDREFARLAQDLGLHFHRTRLGPLRLLFILDAARFIRRNQVQIVHARHGCDYWPAILAAHLSGVRPKIVLSRHLAKSPSSWFSRRFLLSQCDALVAVSHFVAKVLSEGDWDPKSDNPERHRRPPIDGDRSKIRVVYGGFDMSLFRPAEAREQREQWGLAPEHYAFGVVGGYALPRGKGQPEFLRAAARIRAQVPHARFLIIGRGNMKTILESQMAQLGLQDVARLPPYCHNMPAGMNALDCLVLPQVGTEAIPGVVCEAHACGRPVIAYDVDGIPEAFAAAAYGQLVRPGSIDALAEAMLAWAQTPRLEMAARWELHHKVAERFSLERAALDCSRMYESLFAAPQPAGRSTRP